MPDPEDAKIGIEITDEAAALVKMVLAHFPDMVDIVCVNVMQFDELLADIPTDVFNAKMADPDHVDITPYCRRIPMTIPAEELEPETGIHAMMSEVTHRVFVFKDLNYA